VVEFLLSLFVGDENLSDLTPEELHKLRLTAAQVIVSYTFPVEYVPGMKDMLLNKGALLPLLDLVLKGELRAHREIDPKELLFEDQLAEGSTGKVFKGKWKGEAVAIKVFNVNHINFSIEEFNREVAVMGILRHEHLIPFYGACTQSPLHIVTKLMPEVLRKVLSDTAVEVNFAMKLKWALQTAKGMEYLHSKQLMHRDLKSYNILLDEDKSIRIIDFGASRLVDAKSMMTSTIGTLTWMAPEIFNNQMYTEKADVYSYAIVLWEIMTRQMPFADLPSFNIPVAVTKGERPSFPKDVQTHPDAVKLIKACWSGKPKLRPSFSEIVTELTRIIQNRSQGDTSSSDSDKGDPKKPEQNAKKKTPAKEKTNRSV